MGHRGWMLVAWLAGAACGGGADVGAGGGGGDGAGGTGGVGGSGGTGGTGGALPVDWQAPVELGLHDAAPDEIGLAQAGDDAVLVYRSGGDVLARRLVGGVWTEPAEIDGDRGAAEISWLHAAGSSHGDAIAAWIAADGSTVAARWDADSGRWAAPHLLYEPLERARIAGVGLDDEGSAAILFSSWDPVLGAWPRELLIFHARSKRWLEPRSVGTGVRSTSVLAVAPGELEGLTRFVVGYDGPHERPSGVVAYLDRGDGGFFSGAGTFLGPTASVDGTSCVLVDAAGRAHVFWQSDGLEVRSLVDGDVRWTDALRISARAYAQLEVASCAEGAALALRTTDGALQTSRLAEDGWAAVATRIEAGVLDEPPAIAIDPDGTSVILASTDEGIVLVDERGAASFAAGSAPRLARAGDALVAVWLSSDGRVVARVRTAP